MNSFFFRKKFIFSFLTILATKITHKKKSFKMDGNQTHYHKFLFLLEIFRQFLCIWHPKLKKHKKWNISQNFQQNLLIFGLEVVLRHINMCATSQLFKWIFRRTMKFWNILKIWCKMIFPLKFFFKQSC